MDYYNILGVNKSATPDEIKKAYRKLAMENHPDRTGGNDVKFKEINEAYDTLKDANKRSHYDLGGQPNNQQNYGFNTGNMNDMFSNFFNQNTRIKKNRDLRFQINLELEDILHGKNISLEFMQANGRPNYANLRIDPGVEHGEGIRFRGVGDASDTRIPRGDILVTVNLLKHKSFTREGKHLITDVEIEYFDLLLGTSKIIEGLDNQKLKLEIQPGTDPGTRLRCKGYGLSSKGVKGDLFVFIRTKTPKITDKNVIESIRNIKEKLDN